MRVLHAIKHLNRFLGILSGLAIFVITIIITLDIVLRSVFNAPVRGATELSTLLLVGLIYLGLASVQAAKQNYRVEILVALLPPRPRAILDCLTTLLSALVIGILAWFTGIEAWNATLAREMSFGAITFPVWPARIIVAIGLFLLTLQLLIDTLQLLLGSYAASETDATGSLTE